MSKISIIHSIYRPNTRGGAEVVVENIVSGLKEKGENVFVISVGRENKKEEVDGVAVYRIKPFNLFNFLDINQKPKWLRFFWHIIDMFNDVQVWRIYRVLKEEKPDMVMTHNLKGLGYYLPWLLRIMKINHIHTIHDAQLLHPSGLTDNDARLSIVARLYAWTSKKLFGSPRVVVFPSKYSQGIYSKWGFFKNSEKVILGNPIKIVNLKDTHKTESAQFNLLFLGQVEEYKGILKLVRAVRELKEEDNELNVVLHIVGSGSAFSLAKEMAGALLNQSIIFYGRLTHSELKKDIWPEMDVLVNLTKVPESFGMVIAEAFSYGVPVIATNMGALPELVGNECGFLINVDNINELKDKIKFVVSQNEILTPMKQSCVEKAKEYDIENYLDKLIKLYDII